MEQACLKHLLHTVDSNISSYRREIAQFWTILFSHQDGGDAVSLQQILLESLQRQGLVAQILHQDVPLIYAERLTGAAFTILFYCHYAIQDQREDLSVVPSLLAALELYQNMNNGVLPCNVKWLFDGTRRGDFPSGGTMLEAYRARLQADLCIWLRPTNEVQPMLVAGHKGSLCVELAVQTAPHPFPSDRGAITPNAAWRLLWALGSLKDAREEILIDGFYDDLMPADDDIVALLSALPEQSGEPVLFDLYGFQLQYTHVLVPTCTVYGVTSGNLLTAFQSSLLDPGIPNEARAQLHFSLVPAQDPLDIFRKVQHHLSALGYSDVQVTLLYGARPVHIPMHASLVQRLRKALTNAYGRTPLLHPLYPECHPLHALPLPRICPALTVFTPIAYEQLGSAMKQWVLFMEEIARAST